MLSLCISGLKIAVTVHCRVTACCHCTLQRYGMLSLYIAGIQHAVTVHCRITACCHCTLQGYGMMLLEQYKVRPDGTLLTRGPGSYKIPSLGNVPAVFNVALLRDSSNPRAVFSSKVSGQSNRLTASSVLSPTIHFYIYFLNSHFLTEGHFDLSHPICFRVLCDYGNTSGYCTAMGTLKGTV